MTLDITLVTFIILVIGGVMGLWFRIEARVTAEREERQNVLKAMTEDREAKLREITSDLENLRTKFTAFELEVTKNYVPSVLQDKMEDRFVVSIDKLSSRLEQVVAELRGIAVSQAKMGMTITKVSEAVSNGAP